jgi:hypothetical protein
MEPQATGTTVKVKIQIKDEDQKIIKVRLLHE